jgi:hypothetical protein
VNLDPSDGIANGEYGMVWDEEVVYRALASSPNFCPRAVMWSHFYAAMGWTA